MKLFRRLSPGSLVAIALAFVPSVRAQVIITNGGFEAGFSGWTHADQLGSNGSFFIQSGATSPVSGTPVPPPPGGTQAAMSDSQGPGTHVLYQNFVVPSFPVPAARLRFDTFIGNHANAFFVPSPATLDFSTPVLNQQARVDIMSTAADPFSVAAADVLMNAFQTVPGNPLVSGYNNVDVDLSALFAANMGNTLRLRFAEVDNVFGFQFGVDNVVMAVPEPSSMVLCSITGLLAWRRYKRRRAAD